MKTDIHPDYHEIKVQMTDGTVYATRSTWGKPGDTLMQDIDSNSHTAWAGGPARLNEAGGQVAKVKKRFGRCGLQKEARGGIRRETRPDEKTSEHQSRMRIAHA